MKNDEGDAAVGGRLVVVVYSSRIFERGAEQ